jgi:hypothetical protein
VLLTRRLRRRDWQATRALLFVQRSALVLVTNRNFVPQAALVLDDEPNSGCSRRDDAGRRRMDVSVRVARKPDTTCGRLSVCDDA